MQPTSDDEEIQNSGKTGFEPTGATKYCPKCKSSLRRRSRVDIFTRGLICANGHHFFVPIRHVSLDQQKGNVSYSSADDRDIAKAWLTKPELRDHLNDAVAEALEFYLDAEKNGELTQRKNHAPNSYCFLCGEEMTSSGTDGWVLGLQCKKHHQLFERGSRLWTIVDGEMWQLCNEMVPDFFYETLESFLSKDAFKRVTPRQIAELLSRILSTKKPHEPSSR